MNYNYLLKRIFNHDFFVDYKFFKKLQKNVKKFDMIFNFLILYKIY